MILPAGIAALALYQKGLLKMAKAGASRDLLTRLASATVMVPVAVFCVWKGGWPLTLIAALCAGAMAFEWSRMAKSRVPYLMIAGALAANFIHPFDPRWALMALVGVGVIAMALEQRDGFKSTALLGTLYAGGIPLAMQALRANPEAGWTIAMGVMVLSWSSDTSAYFVGRAIGGPKLSPKDTGAAFAYFVQGPTLLWGFLGILVSISAQIGDLFESQVKRRHGVKDTSGFLPGHGGVMDRLDGFGTACVAMVGILRLFPEFAPMLVG